MSLTAMPPGRAPLEIAEEAARDILSGLGLSLVRIWLLEPPDTRTGFPFLAASACAQPHGHYGGMLEGPVAKMLTGAQRPAPVMIADPSTDDRFSGALPAGGFVGLPIAAGDLRFGYLEAYSDGPFPFSAAASLEAKVNTLIEVLDSARATHALESSNRGSVLIADDDAGIRGLVRLLLERKGFDVTDVANGLMAYETARRKPFDLIIIDWVMPLMDGREATLKLKSDPATREIPVVMLTSQSRIDDKVAALEAGVQDFLTKPFDSRELVARVEQQMRWRKLLAADAAAPADAEPAAQSLAAPESVAASVQAVQAAALDAVPAGNASGDLWVQAVEAAQLGKHREALAFFLQEAERCDERKQFPRAAIAYRSASTEAGKLQNLDLSNKLIRLAGKMYLCWSETASDTKAVQEGYLNAARCFLAAGNLQLAKKSVDYAHSIDSVLADDRPPALQSISPKER